MEQDENVFKGDTSKALKSRIFLDILIALCSLCATAALVLALVYVRGDMNIATRLTTALGGTAFFTLALWCIIDLCGVSKDKKLIEDKDDLEQLQSQARYYEKNKKSKTSLFWYVMAGIALIPAVALTVFMIMSSKGASINALYMSPVYALVVVSLYLGVYSEINLEFVGGALAEGIVSLAQPVAQPAPVEAPAEPQLTPEQLRMRQIAEAQRRAAMALAQQQAAQAQQVEQPKELTLEEIAEAQRKEAQEALLAQQQAAQTVEQPVVEEPAVEEVPLPEEPELPELDFGDYDFGDDYQYEFEKEQPKVEEKPAPQPAVSSNVQIIFVMPGANGQMSPISSVNIPIETASGTQTIQLVMNKENEKPSALLLEGGVVEQPVVKKTRGRKPGSKNSTKKKTTSKKATTKKTTKKSTAKKPVAKKTAKKELAEAKDTTTQVVADKKPAVKKTTTKKSSTATKTTKSTKTAKPAAKTTKKTATPKKRATTSKVDEHDAVGSALDSIGKKLDRISRELTE